VPTLRHSQAGPAGKGLEPVPEMAKRSSLRDVARLAGVSLATASRVLTDHPDVAIATRDRVRQAMARLGYRPDPVLRALGSYRWPSGRRSASPGLAYLVDRWTGSGPTKLEALRQRGEGLGYRVERCILRPGGDLRALSGDLSRRGFGGLVIDLHGDDLPLQDIPWEGFAAVLVGEGLPDLDLPRVSSDWIRIMEDGHRRLRAAGCRRIGILVRRYLGRGLREELIGAAHAILGMHGESTERILITSTDPTVSDGDIARWFTTIRPDGVIGDTPSQAQQLAEAGADVGTGCRFLTVLNGGQRLHRRSVAGYRIDLNERIVAAVDQVHARLLHDERGLMARPSRLLLDGQWVDGGSMG